MSISQEFDTNIRRKSDHLRIVANEKVAHTGPTLFDDVHLMHQALPEVDFDEINLTTEFFGKHLAAPLMITSMTGGVEFSAKLNRGLAEVAQTHGIAFAVGSQRVMLRRTDTIEHFAVRKYIPDGVLLGNIGAAQLGEYSTDDIAGLMTQIEADGLCVHLNPAQEMIQQEGHRAYRGLFDALARLMDAIDGKLLVKESGAGLSPQALKRLAKIGVPYVDVSGSGGTSWTRVESYRAASTVLRSSGKVFADWGVPTAFSLLAAKKIMPETTCLIASGGIENGLDAAKALALGANIAGFARAILLEFLDNGAEGASAFVDRMVYQIKTAMLLTDVTTVAGLKKVPRVYTGQLRHWLADALSE